MQINTLLSTLFISLVFTFSLNALDLNDVSNAVSANTSKTKNISSESSDLTSLLVKQLVVNNKQATGGTGSILSYAKSALSATDYKTVADAIPNSDSLLSSAPSSKGGLGGLASSLGADSSTSGLATLASQFSSLDLDSGMVTKFLPVILDYLKGSGSSDAMSLLSGLF